MDQQFVSFYQVLIRSQYLQALRSANEDAEYAAEWGMYDEAESMKRFEDDFPTPAFVTPLSLDASWRRVYTMHSFCFGADLVTYRRYPLLDAARIEEQ